MTMIYELLDYGADHARTAAELASVLNCDVRMVTRRIEMERRQGQPICASSISDNPGYFLPANAEELQRYCEQLKKRAIQIFKTRQALIKFLQKMNSDPAQL